jgi:hypothetical protein
VCERLSEWRLEKSGFSAELIVGELVTHVIRYGGGSIRLQLIKDDTLIYEVWDGNTTTPHLRGAQPSDEGRPWLVPRRPAHSALGNPLHRR